MKDIIAIIERDRSPWFSEENCPKKIRKAQSR